MILPAFTDARQFLGPDAISFSEMQAFAHCEWKWNAIYNVQDREEYPSTDAMELGSEMHRLLGNYYMQTGGTVSELDTANWLMDRYDMHYHDYVPKLKMEAVEIPFAVWHKEAGVWVFGWLDGLVRDLDTDELWITEFKTMGNWSKLNQLPKDKQVSLYIWAARRAGYNVKGVMYDAIRTYKWTGKNADQHEPAESFQRLWVERTDEEIQDLLYELDSVISRRGDIKYHIDPPIRNVGQACDWCPVMAKCYGIELTLEPEDDVLAF